MKLQNSTLGVEHRILSCVGLKRWDYTFCRPVFRRDYTLQGFPLLSTNVAICIKSSPIVYVNHSFRLTLLNYYSSLWNLADSLNPCPGTRTFLVKTEGLGVLSISSLVFLPKELGDFQFNRSETYPLSWFLNFNVRIQQCESMKVELWGG